MGIETIEKRLNERFSEPLPEYYERRIIFWQDEEQRFIDDIDNIKLENAKILKLNGTNFFIAKKTLLHDDTKSNFLVYDPNTYQKLEDNVLYDIALYCGEPFSADKSSLIMTDYSIENTPEMRKALSLYPKFFDSKERCDKLKAISNGTLYTSPAKLHTDIMNVLCSSKTGSVESVILSVLLDSLIDEENTCLCQIEKFGSLTAFWTMIQKNTGYIYSPEKPNIIPLLSHIVFTASAQNLPHSVLKPFSSFVSERSASFCYSLLHDFIDKNEAGAYELISYIENKYLVSEKLKKYETADIINCDIFPCIDEIILSKYFDEVNENIINDEKIMESVQKRKALSWYSRFENYYTGLFYIAKMQSFYNENQNAFHITDAAETFNMYTKKFYLMDSYYRHFHLAFSLCLKTTVSSDIDDLFKSGADYVEQLYQNWYLKELTSMWFNAGDLHLSGKEFNEKIQRQSDFYENIVTPIKEKQTVFVVISDALRYEVANELANELNIKVRGSVEISAQQSVFPSITKYGMAALLPGDEKYVDENSDITVNGMKCASTEQRKAILQAFDETSSAVQYKDFIKMKKDEKNEFIKGKRVIYIYHNIIDAIAEKSATQSKVFEACSDAVNELCALVQTLANLRGGSEVIITSDHGFNYTYSPLNETQKITKTSFENIIESGRRYIVSTESLSCDYLAEIYMDINTKDSTLHGYSPLDIVRIKQSGDGENFVHGGMSLQECVVPIVRFKNIRLDSKKYQANKERYESAPVELMLLASNHKISNSLFSLYFLQKDPVDMNKRAQTYEVFLVDGCGNRVSDTHKIIADKTDTETKNRQFKVNFCLNQSSYDKNESYYLLINDDNANEIQRIEYEIDIAFTAEDFGF